MKLKSKHFGPLFILLLTLIIAPGITHAAWYNPFTWFNHTATVNIPTEPVTPVTTPVEVPIAPQPVLQSPARIIPPVAPIASEHNPEDTALIATLQAQIATLTADNANLHAQITALTTTGGTAPVYTKDQLSAQYQHAHPLEACTPRPNEGGISVTTRCTEERNAYIQALNAWVTEKLATQ